jgi:two-component system cell cycle response regulator
MTAAVASDLCNRINSKPFHIAGVDRPIHVTISIGAVIGGGTQHSEILRNSQAREACVNDLITNADRALYSAKHAGRNRVSLAELAA